jgi:hypothetical protein
MNSSTGSDFNLGYAFVNEEFGEIKVFKFLFFTIVTVEETKTTKSLFPSSASTPTILSQEEEQSARRGGTGRIGKADGEGRTMVGINGPFSGVG